jgi:signal transduction histidine kinase
LRRAAWAFPLYLLLINLFVLPIAFGGLVIFGAGRMDPDGFVVSLPLAHGQQGLALAAFIGGLSAATGMVIVEAIAVSTMVCNDLLMPWLLRTRRFGARAAGDLTRTLLAIRRGAIVGVMLLGYLYFRLAGEAYALVSIGLISFAAVAQFAPAMLGGIYWKGGTKLGALVGLSAGFALWVYTLLLPSFVKSGWLDATWLSEGPGSIALLKPEQLLGLTGLDSLTHSLFWSLLANAGAYVVVSLARTPSGQEASQALLFVDIFERSAARRPVFWRGRARVPDLLQLAGRFVGAERARQLIDEHLRATGGDQTAADARMVQLVETQLAGAIGSASARVMVAAVVEEEPLALDDVMRMLEETSQLRALDRMKDDFMASVTHELRTPLAAIRAVTELMRDDAEMPGAQREAFLDIVVTETERLGRLVNQVLDMAKIESGHGEWHNSDVDLRTLLAHAVQTTAAMFKERGATVQLHLPDALPTLRADRDRLLQVLMNLLSNAAKFVPREGGRVDMRLRSDDAGVTVEVHDNGPGVPRDQQTLIFEKFHQGGDTANRPQGTGLGLPISRRIVEHFGGRMMLRSEPGQGACFGFFLPWVKDARGEAP